MEQGTRADALHTPKRLDNEHGPMLVLLNPSARIAVEGADSEKIIAQRLRERGVQVDIVVSGSEEEAQAQAADAARSKTWRTVVAAGGDGTIHAVASGMQAGLAEPEGAPDGAARGTPDVVLGILPLGTMNNLARSLGIPEDLDAACDVLANAKPHPLDLGMIGEQPFIEVAGMGLEAALFPCAEALKGRPWLHPGAILDAIRVLNSFKPVRILLNVDGRRIRTRGLQVSICNAPSYGMGFAVAPDARLDDGRLDVVIYERFGRWELLRHYMSIMGGRRDFRARVRRLTGRQITVTPVGATWDVHADGTCIGNTPTTATVQPGVLRVLAPSSAQQYTNQQTVLPGQVDALLRVATPAAIGVTAQAAVEAAARTSESFASSTEQVRLALVATSDEARKAVGVEPPHQSARRASILRLIYLGAFLLALVTTFAVRRMNVLPGDVQITRAVQRRRNPARDRFWSAVAAPGFPVLSTPLVVVAAAAFWLLRLPVEAVFILLANGTNGANWLIKRVVRRERPTDRLVHVARVINEPGFPSGHVMHYLSFYGFLAAAALANLRPSRLRSAVVAGCVSMIGLVGPSRVYLGAHWPSDVAAGYLFGGLWLGGLLEAYARVKRWRSPQA